MLSRRKVTEFTDKSLEIKVGMRNYNFKYTILEYFCY